MIRRGLTLLVCAYLLVWVPLGFAGELFASVPSLPMRGTAAVLELTAHAAVAVLCATAGYMVSIGAPAAAALAMSAVVAAALAAVQSIYWTVLPNQLAPGEPLPMVVFVSLRALCLLVAVRVATGASR